MTETAPANEPPAASTEALVITAPDGTAYAVPVVALAPWRLCADLAAQLREPHEVAGHIIIVGGYQALGVAPTSGLAGSYLTPAALAAVHDRREPFRQR